VSSSSTGDDQGLLDRAQAFANELASTLTRVLAISGDCLTIQAGPTQRRRASTRLIVCTPPGSPIKLTINGEPALELILDFKCEWDHQRRYLAVRSSAWQVRVTDVGDPLFRYEFVAEPGGPIPCAHLQIHAHRDEIVYHLFRGSRGKAKARAAAVDGSSGKAMPRLSNLHFPLGGPRMRPCLEDLLQFLIVEFAIDTAAGCQAALDEGRTRWRRRQIGASVRDAPEEAARVLGELGYSITAPPGGPRSERPDKLTQP